MLLNIVITLSILQKLQCSPVIVSKKGTMLCHMDTAIAPSSTSDCSCPSQAVCLRTQRPSCSVLLMLLGLLDIECCDGPSQMGDGRHIPAFASLPARHRPQRLSDVQSTTLTF